MTLTQEPRRELTEPEAIRRAQDGDATAFEYLYKSHSKRVYSLCLQMLKNTSDAEDLTQQIFLRLFRKIGTFRRDSRFSTWLHRVAVNAVLMHLRRKRPAEIHPGGSNQAATNLDDPQEFGVATLRC
jgi:RNA polymerase sigma factor (sigma-70 family)